MSELVPNIVTTCSFKRGREFITKMRITEHRGGGVQRNLELTVVDKCTGENWRSSYESAYIENLTHKTGNYKQFDVFVAMLQSGLLNTSDCISLDLLTFEDLELLRNRRGDNSVSSNSTHKSSNRRYLILTYTVQFDRIHYPLPLEYCGPPDPFVLQATIRKLEGEIERIHKNGVNKELQKRVEQLTIANRQLIEENRRLSNANKDVHRLISALKHLENDVSKERQKFRSQLEKLRVENSSLRTKISQLTKGIRVQSPSPVTTKYSTPPRSVQSRRSLNQRSRSPSANRLLRRTSSSPASSVRSVKSNGSSRVRETKSYHFGAKAIDFGNLESRIQNLGKLLKDGINLN